jgi:transposase
MATERLSMRNTREVLRQKWVLKKSHREVASSVGISTGGVSGVLERATVAGLTWADVEGLDDEVLETKLFGERPAIGEAQRPLPDPVYIHTERRKSGVTLELLHHEYLEKYPDGYRYTQFCEYYRQWLERHRLTMRQVHRAGEKVFVDYSGKKPHLVDPTTGEVTDVELFVAVLGASNYTFAEATRTQSSPDWIASNIHALEYFEGVPGALVPDQLKSGVTQPCRYEPGVQRTYAELARHYGTAVIPARPGKARDKAKVESGVLIAQRWILARLRHETYFTLEALNQRIAELVEDLNHRQMRPRPRAF